MLNEKSLLVDEYLNLNQLFARLLDYCFPFRIWGPIVSQRQKTQITWSPVHPFYAEALDRTFEFKNILVKVFWGEGNHRFWEAWQIWSKFIFSNPELIPKWYLGMEYYWTPRTLAWGRNEGPIHNKNLNVKTNKYIKLSSFKIFVICQTNNKC